MHVISDFIVGATTIHIAVITGVIAPGIVGIITIGIIGIIAIITGGTGTIGADN